MSKNNLGYEGNLGERYKDKQGLFGYTAAKCRMTDVNENDEVHLDILCPYLLHSPAC